MAKICLLGGTGFVGRHLASDLARRGYEVTVPSRHRERHRELLVLPRVEVVETDVHHPARLPEAFRGHAAVVNLIGILNEGGRETFARVHAELPAKVAAACREAQVPRLVHLSALGAGPDAPSRYLVTKHAGEEAVHASAGEDLRVTSFRPAVIFGPDDDFFNRFARLLAAVPFAFPLAAPDARLSPVHVADVVAVIRRALRDRSTYGQRYDLCGPRTYTLRELVEYTAATLGLRRRIIGLDDTWSRIQARCLELAPGKPFSRDNYLSLQVPQVTDDNGFAHFGIVPDGIEAVVPRYLGGRGRASRYRRLRASARRG